jgi:S1-C subfamily serine protease
MRSLLRRVAVPAALGGVVGFALSEELHRRRINQSAVRPLFTAASRLPVRQKEVVRTTSDLAHRPGSAQRRPLDSHFIADAVKEAAPAVVAIHIQAEPLLGFFPQASFGSGFILDEEGTILTNAHVVELAHGSRSGMATVTLTDGTSYTADVVAADTLSDLAVLRITDSSNRKFPCVKLASSDHLVPGELVVAIGSPLTLTNSCTSGVVSNVNREDVELGIQSHMSYIQTDAPITIGNSGGPLVNLDGKVVGINSMVSGLSPNIGFAIPIDRAKEIIEELKTYGRVQRPYIGISMLSVSHNTRHKFIKLPEGMETGVLVVDVKEGSPAARAGLCKQMIITEVNGKPVSTPNEVIKHLGKPGKPVTFKALSAQNGHFQEHQLEIVPQVS